MGHHYVKLVNVGLYLLGKLGTIGVDWNLEKPDVSIRIIRHETDVVISRVGYVIITEEGLDRMVSKNKCSHHLFLDHAINFTQEFPNAWTHHQAMYKSPLFTEIIRLGSNAWKRI